jgi:hypothetical protein
MSCVLEEVRLSLGPHKILRRREPNRFCGAMSL